MRTSSEWGGGRGAGSGPGGRARVARPTEGEAPPEPAQQELRPPTHARLRRRCLIRWIGLLVCTCRTLALPAAAAAGEAPMIDGQVLDAGGRPVPNAEVGEDLFGGRTREKPGSVRAGADGCFQIPAPSKWGYLFAMAAGHGLTAQFISATTTWVELRLGRPRTLAGRVVSEGGQTAEGVVVEVRAMRLTEGAAGQPVPGMYSLTIALLPEALMPRYTARTNADGRYRLEDLPAGPVSLRFTDPRFQSEEIEVIGTPPVVRLKPGYRIRGRVVHDAKGLAGWRVWTIGSAPGSHGQAMTTADGSFTVGGLPVGRVTVSAGGQPDSPLMPVPVQVTITAGKPEPEVIIRTEDTGTVVGRAVDVGTRAPLPQIPLGITGKNVPYWPLSEPDGSFRLRLLPGKYHIFARQPVPSSEEETVYYHPDKDHPPEGVDVIVRAGQEVAVTLPVKGWRSLSGQVCTGDGKPIPKAAVTARWGREGSAIGLSDAEGRFTVSGLPDEPVTLTARGGPGGLVVPLTVKPPFPKDLSLTLSPLPQMTITGRVVDDRGRPVKEAIVQLRSNRPSELRIGLPDQEAITDAEGRYRFVVLDLTARYTAGVGTDRVGAQHYLRRGGGLPVGDAGAERRLTDLVVVSCCAAASGRVLDAVGKPAKGAIVFWPTGMPEHQATADAEGRFAIERLPDRPITLGARGREHGSAFVRVVPGQEATIRLKD